MWHGCSFVKPQTCHRLLGWRLRWACNISIKVDNWGQKLQIWQRLKGVFINSSGVGSGCKSSGRSRGLWASQAEIDHKYISHRCQLWAPAVNARHRVVPSIPQQTQAPHTQAQVQIQEISSPTAMGHGTPRGGQERETSTPKNWAEKLVDLKILYKWLDRTNFKTKLDWSFFLVTQIGEGLMKKVKSGLKK